MKRIPLLAAVLSVALARTDALGAGEDMRDEMNAIAEAVRFVLPLDLADARLREPALHARVESSLSLLEHSSQRLAAHGGGSDAAFSYLSRVLANAARDAHRRFVAGRASEAQFLVQQLGEACIACHSRLPGEPEPSLQSRFADGAEPSRLPLPQRARFEYATHQFERALASYEALLASPAAAPNDLDLLGHLDDYLELCIRVRGDPGRAARALERFAGRKDLAPTLRREVRLWIDSLRALERRSPGSGALDEARALLREARDSRRFGDARDALVYYLQASGVLHRFSAAESAPAASDRAEVYYLLGVIETQVGKSFWLSQAEAFLEAAIRTAPGEPAARRAYDLLEEFLVAGYTGSEGTHVPPDIAARLDELRVMAFGEPAA